MDLNESKRKEIDTVVPEPRLPASDEEALIEEIVSAEKQSKN